MPADDRRLGLLFIGAPAVPEMVRLAQRAEERGFDSVWIAETRLTRDGVVPTAAVAMATRRVKVGTGVLNVYTRGAALTAITFLSLEELAPGRVVLGIGTGSPGVLEAQGIPFDKPLTRLREYVDVIRPLMRGEEITYEGKTIWTRGCKVEDILSSGEAAIAPKDMPLYLGVTGPKALEYAGEVADGVFYNTSLPVEYMERAEERLRTGAARTGRDAGSIDRAMAVFTSPDHDSATGKEKARRFVTTYLSLFPNIARETGIDEELMDDTRRKFHEQGLDVAARNVSDEWVDRLTAAGTPAECRERIEERRAAGLRLPILVPADGAIELVVETMAA